MTAPRSPALRFVRGLEPPAVEVGSLWKTAGARWWGAAYVADSKTEHLIKVTYGWSLKDADAKGRLMGAPDPGLAVPSRLA